MLIEASDDALRFLDTESGIWIVPRPKPQRLGWRIGPISRWLDPHLGWCFRCRTTWRFVELHSTHYEVGRGCFPLCERCWSELTPVQRLPFYEVLWRQWLHQGCAREDMVGNWADIKRAVLAGV